MRHAASLVRSRCCLLHPFGVPLLWTLVRVLLSILKSCPWAAAGRCHVSEISAAKTLSELEQRYHHIYLFLQDPREIFSTECSWADTDSPSQETLRALDRQLSARVDSNHGALRKSLRSKSCQRS